MTALDAGADLCAEFAPWVYGGRIGYDTAVAPGAWRGKAWPCPASSPLRSLDGAEIGRVTCTCDCHSGLLSHVLPPRARHTHLHPTDVLGRNRAALPDR